LEPWFHAAACIEHLPASSSCSSSPRSHMHASACRQTLGGRHRSQTQLPCGMLQAEQLEGTLKPLASTSERSPTSTTRSPTMEAGTSRSTPSDRTPGTTSRSAQSERASAGTTASPTTIRKPAWSPLPAQPRKNPYEEVEFAPIQSNAFGLQKTFKVSCRGWQNRAQLHGSSTARASRRALLHGLSSARAGSRALLHGRSTKMAGSRALLHGSKGKQQGCVPVPGADRRCASHVGNTCCCFEFVTPFASMVEAWEEKSW
jgi:hypothetical protein